MKTQYMHTLDHKPAFFDGEQICTPHRNVVQLVDSLKQIRRDQAASRNFRDKQDWEIPYYDYVLVRVK